MTVDYGSLYIGGAWTRPSSGERIEAYSASTEELLGSVPAAGPADIDAAVAAARRAFDDPHGWATWEPAWRADYVERFAAELLARSDEMVRRVSMQNGMPIRFGKPVEGAVPATMLRYYAELVRQLPASEVRRSLVAGTTEVRREPLGVVGAIVPWNFPQTLAFFKIAPALAAGCTVVMKPSSETVLDAMLVAEAAAAADLPAGVLNIVPGAGRTAGAHLVAHPGVDKIAFTGSTDAGRAIAETCGRLLKPVTLELGGKSAALILDDADLSAVIPNLFAASLMNQGQSCYICTRILAPRRRYGEVVDALSDMVRALRIGDPLDRSTVIGPVASAGQREIIEGYIAKGKAEGGRITVGGGRPAGFDRGWYVEPTVFADVDNSATIGREEIFGPVLAVIPFDSDADAVRLANDSPYGLGGTVWTSDVERGAALARRVQTGSIGVNGYTMDHGAPFGGVKDSGLGRELGPEGLSAYQQYKSIYLP
ncbi:acyl-CoA reductase-like NAD-dependent aldehyde dehydrogenase [Nocardia tenerifensis]|uniref:Acyl-CoA reductase-like NAD-dependent aldehyde dehydrogenase n=1 Tax=Nocardia tenerifensis TaxID=228006 RepID=A0A318KFH1_9NOCA|nr:aldehyde dehydrogenase [Nocardia tenerifensis]PXX58442.1 acyl-CoA reductase-like NAD-dependent aldehyde dehydrogenase [Nocardia tenerifensis]